MPNAPRLADWVKVDERKCEILWSGADPPSLPPTVLHMDAHFPAVFARRDHLFELGPLNHLRRTGRLRTLLPGVYCWAEMEDSFELRAEAVTLWDPAAVFLGSAAARLSWWPTHPEPTILVSGTRARAPRPWLKVSAKKVPTDHVAEFNMIRIADPALAVLEMLSFGDPHAICEALRRGATTMAHLNNALKHILWADGNVARRQLLRAARDEPWSPLELDAHQSLRSAGIRGWSTNHLVRTPAGKLYVDVAFVERRIAVELDGWEHHGTRGAFHADRERWNALTLEGWQVLHFTYRTLDTLIPTLTRALRRRR